MENEIMQQVLLFTSILSPITTAFLEVIKRAVAVPKNFLPLLSVLIGLIIGYLSYPFTDMDTALRLWAGAFAGLSGTGIYEMVLKKREGMSKKSN
ncbi:holin [Bacillus massiliglaciei]|uniref:holin n=1 Tax=Bacillus massiliglaciei TaxID=1816693 RepID=UPI002D219955|nr:holin [Bacillus massiliglaciei]